MRFTGTGVRVIEDALAGRGRRQLGRSLSRWPRTTAEAGYDVVAWTCGMLVAAKALNGPAWHPVTSTDLWYGVTGICAIVAGCGLAAGLYRGRYLRGSRDEVIAVGQAVALTAGCLLATGPVLMGGLPAWPEQILGGALLAVAAMLGARYAAFAMRLRSVSPAPAAVKIIVFGAGEAGTQLIHRLAMPSAPAYRPVAILDDDPGKRRLRIRGVPVLGGRGQMAEAAEQTGARVLIIAIAGGSGKIIRDLAEAAEHCGLVPKVIPSVRELLTGGAKIDGVRDPRISDLLGRRVVTTDVTPVREHIAGQRVLVTGAGGSIGAELCRQLHRLGPAELIMLDRDESALHAVQFSLRGHALLDSEETVLADIRDQRRVREVFARFRPDIVFHAAALKHLPLLESCPAEALKSNVWGTLTVLEAAAAHSVRAFVNISTDKAADPVSVLGCSKRITERLTADMAARTGATYLSVRFGNVLGSRGSVLTTLSAQAAAGGPVTVTHPEVRRYFMLAEEAAHLVLQAAAIGQPGEVLVLDMGEPVRIADIARRLTSSTGREVDIVFTGLRPGEKMIEDRLGPGEVDRRPNHPLISQIPVLPLRADQVTGLDPHLDAGSLRRALARCAREIPGTRPSAIPPQQAARAATPLGHQAPRRPAGQFVPRPSQLRRRPAMPPSEFGQVRHQPVKQAGRVRKSARRPARRVGHVVLGAVAEQRGAVASRVRPGQPAGQRLTGPTRADLPTAPDEFPERERARPRLRLGDHGIPEVLPGHREHQRGIGQVGGGYDAAAVRGGLDPVPGQHRDQLRGRGGSLAGQPGRPDRYQPGGHAERGQPPGQQGGRHRRPADVRRAQDQDAGRRSRPGAAICAVFPGIAVNCPPPVSRETNKSTGTTIPAVPEFRLRPPWRSILRRARTHLARPDRHSFRSAATCGSERKS